MEMYSALDVDKYLDAEMTASERHLFGVFFKGLEHFTIDQEKGQQKHCHLSHSLKYRTLSS